MKNAIYLFLFVLFVSCADKEQKTVNNNQPKALLSVSKTHASIEQIKQEFKKEVEGWKELNSINTFISRFEKTSPNAALSNALELRDLVKNLNDSIVPSLYDIPSFKARVNILNNEVLRLADLTSIPAVTADEVNIEVDKIIAAVSSLNSKINTIHSQKRFEDSIDVDFEFIGIDSTKIDSISKNSIDKKLKEELLEEEDKMKNKKRADLKPFKPLKKKN